MHARSLFQFVSTKLQHSGRPSAQLCAKLMCYVWLYLKPARQSSVLALCSITYIVVVRGCACSVMVDRTV